MDEARLRMEGGKDSGKKHTDRSRIFVASRPDWPGRVPSRLKHGLPR
jgi:hypothetical protein